MVRMSRTEINTITVTSAMRLNELLGYKAVDVDNILSVDFNSRLKSSLGRAIRNRLTGSFRIEFSTLYFNHKDTTMNDILSVVFHELIHTVDGCFNHGDKFNSISRLVERKTQLTEIAGTTKKDTGDYRKNTAKYKVVCQADGCDVIDYRRKTMHRGLSTGMVWNYRCSCGGSLKQTQLY